MRYFVFIITISIIFSGCSANVETNSAAANSANSNSPITNLPNINSTAETNSPPLQTQSNKSLENSNANNFNSPNITINADKIKPKKDELPVGSVAALDDSVIFSESRGRDFVETRTFKNHPVLVKIEKIMNGKTNVYKVYLKNGKVIDAPEEKMKSYETLSAASILYEIGLQPKPTPNGDEEKKVKP